MDEETTDRATTRGILTAIGLSACLVAVCSTGALAVVAAVTAAGCLIATAPQEAPEWCEVPPAQPCQPAPKEAPESEISPEIQRGQAWQQRVADGRGVGLSR